MQDVNRQRVEERRRRGRERRDRERGVDDEGALEVLVEGRRLGGGRGTHIDGGVGERKKQRPRGREKKTLVSELKKKKKMRAALSTSSSLSTRKK